MYVVAKPIPSGAETLPRGEVVDIKGWRSGQRLIEQRYLVPAALQLVPSLCACGRQWESPELAKAHCAKAPKGGKE